MKNFIKNFDFVHLLLYAFFVLVMLAAGIGPQANPVTWFLLGVAFICIDIRAYQCGIKNADLKEVGEFDADGIFWAREGAAIERRECIDDCEAEARDDGTAQRIIARIRARSQQ